MKRRTDRTGSLRAPQPHTLTTITQHLETMEQRRLLSTIVALTTNNHLLKFDSETPGDILSDVTITGLQGGESILGIDVRPKTGELFALGSNERLYTINPNTGAASFVAALSAEPGDATNPFTDLDGDDFGIDFNPLSDRLRVVSDADQNLRINPTNGAVVTDAPLAYAANELHEGESPFINDIAYSNNDPDAKTTRLFGVDSVLAILVRQNPENDGVLRKVGKLGKPEAPNRGFDIGPGGGAFAAKELQYEGGAIGYGLVSVNLATGADTSRGPIGDGNTEVTDMAILPSIQLSTSLYAANEGRRANIVIRRTDGDVGTYTVRLRTLAGSADAGGDFTARNRVLTFEPGVTEMTVQLRIANDATGEGDETFDVALSDPTGGAVIGKPARASVRINRNDLPDNDGPKLRSMGLTGPSRAISGAVLQFNEDLNVGRAENLDNYTWTAVAADGTRRNINIGSATYDFANRRVTLRARRVFGQTQFRNFQFVLRSGRNGLADVADNPLNGRSNGARPGGDEAVAFRIFSGRSISFTDNDGDRATLTIKNGGRIDGIRPLNAPAAQRTQFWILDPIALRSTLSGTVTRTSTSSGVVVISEIIGLDKKEYTPLLTNTSFRVNTLTFSSNATGIG